MAEIYFVKDGKGDEHTSSAHVIDIAVATKALRDSSTEYREQGPTFNGEKSASAFAPYRYVVLRVNAQETNDLFAQAGYYWIVGLKPDDCRDKLGLTNIPQA